MSQLNSTLPSLRPPLPPALLCSLSPLRLLLYQSFFAIATSLRSACRRSPFIRRTADGRGRTDGRRGCKLAKTCNFNDNQQQRRPTTDSTYIYTLPEVRSRAGKGRIGNRVPRIPSRFPLATRHFSVPLFLFLIPISP